MRDDDGPLTLGDVVTLQRGTTYKSALLGQPGPVLLGLASIQRNGGFRDDNLKTYGGDSPTKLTLRTGDIFVSLKDVTQSADLLGAVARVPPHIAVGRVTQDTVKLSFIRSDVPSRYLYWLLRTPVYREYCRAHAIGTTNLSLAREDFLAFPVPKPGTRELTLVETLDALDDKIELNRRMNATLEAMARALFQSWFVDFDPVRAKRDHSGPQTVGWTGFICPPARPAWANDEAVCSPYELATLFPDSFRDSGTGHIPPGWEVRSLDRIASYLNGLALQKFPAGDRPTLPVIKIAQLRKGNAAEADRCDSGLPPDYIVYDGDVLFSWSGSLEVEIWCGGIGALNQHLFKVTSSEFPKWFYYLWTRHHLDEFRLIAASKATTMGHIQRGHLSAAKVVVPPRPLLDQMSKAMSPLVEQIIASRVQSRTLATLRDTLLPKLLNGELRV